MSFPKYGATASYNTKLYKVWFAIKERCFNPNNKSFHNYGGRGITICKEWINDYASFRDWSYENGYQEGLSIDRIDNNGNYSPDNCRWTSRKVQGNNRRNNLFYTLDGRTQSVAQWAEELGIKHNTLLLRLEKWPLRRALTEPRHLERVTNERRRTK